MTEFHAISSQFDQGFPVMAPAILDLSAYWWLLCAREDGEGGELRRVTLDYEGSPTVRPLGRAWLLTWLLISFFALDLLPSKDGKDLTKCFLLQVVNILLHYIKKMFDVKSKILDFHHPHQLLEGLDGFNLELSDHPESLEQLLVDCTDTLKYGVKTGHPRFFNQLSSGLDVVGLAGAWLTATANTNTFTYEIAPVFTIMEMILLKKMYGIIGWGETEADGIFASGGSISNLYVILVARYKQYPEIKRQGMTTLLCCVLFVSEQGHYSVKKAAAILGIGTDNVIEVKCDERGKMIPAELEKNILQANKKGHIPFCVTTSAGSTVFRAFDPLHDIAYICEAHRLWMHVDAAWGGGGGLLLSRNHSHKLSGIERANSVTWNPHKLMGIPLQRSAILIWEKGLLEACNEMHAAYLFQPDKLYNVDFDTGDKTIQRGRHVDVFKLWLMWKAKGTCGFEAQISRHMELAKYFCKVLKKKDNFKLVFDAEPEFTNVCFWYFPPRLKHIPEGFERDQELQKVNALLQRWLIEKGTAMISYQPCGDKVNFFRMVFSNPATRRADVDYLTDAIERLGKDL
ncbi:LOW QUALITY PROTEIN: glutamate decarboxylase 1-like [Neofelis nebulosa]|uniref:LOW QUALITY PROTEIN: glutamate decarboxylase 1-like n=1 Tax=Neofelis nebulosa TaxID=61452 RepID=UPI00272B9904|nr:LOW QUALITY PROTEIN: glutamate decarboxylase 1-like [Neofelis nebulosa]